MARQQLQHLLDMSDRERITLRVIPFDAGAYPGSGQSIHYAHGPVSQLDTVYLDQSHGPVFLDADAQLHKYRTLFDRVEAIALSPEKSRDLIHPVIARAVKGMPMNPRWQKSSYCSEGDSCVHIATAPTGTIHLTESGDPTRRHTRGHPPGLRRPPPRTQREPDPWLTSPRTSSGNAPPPRTRPAPGPGSRLAFGDDDLVYIRETSDPETVVTTTQKKWDAFVLGVQAGEFDHFVEGVEGVEDGSP